MENVYSTPRNSYSHWKTNFTELIAILINSKFVSFCLCWLKGFTHLVCRFFYCIKKITVEVTAGAPSLPMHFDGKNRVSYFIHQIIWGRNGPVHAGLLFYSFPCAVALLHTMFSLSRILKIKCFTISELRVDKPSKDFSVHWQNQGHFIDSLPKEFRRKVTLVKHNSYNPFIHSSSTCSKIALRKWDWDCKWACSNQKTFLLQQYDSILASSERWCWKTAGSSKKKFEFESMPCSDESLTNIYN